MTELCQKQPPNEMALRACCLLRKWYPQQLLIRQTEANQGSLGVFGSSPRAS